MKYKFKEGDSVWADVKFTDLPWRRGHILSRFNNSLKGNAYGVLTTSGKGFTVLEKDIMKADKEG